jgi:catechol 2,3-dioxygenase-like lactoylglutathione lyase family enzyme
MVSFIVVGAVVRTIVRGLLFLVSLSTLVLLFHNTSTSCSISTGTGFVVHKNQHRRLLYFQKLSLLQLSSSFYKKNHKSWWFGHYRSRRVKLNKALSFVFSSLSSASEKPIDIDDTRATDNKSIQNQYQLQQHHTAIRTRNITTSINFYSTLFGYHVECKFRAGPARAAWLKQESIVSNTIVNQRIELIEVPSYMLNEKQSRATDTFQYPSLLGYNHLAFDVTNIETVVGNDNNIPMSTPVIASLQQYLDVMNTASIQNYNKTIRLALQPKQQLIGQNVYEIAFIYDPDGCIIELLYYQGTVKQSITSGWDPIVLNMNSSSSIASTSKQSL